MRTLRRPMPVGAPGRAYGPLGPNGLTVGAVCFGCLCLCHRHRHIATCALLSLSPRNYI